MILFIIDYYYLIISLGNRMEKIYCKKNIIGRTHYYGLWIHISAGSNNLKLKCLDGFVSHKQLFIIVMFYQLFGLILTAPIHCRGLIGEQVM